MDFDFGEFLKAMLKNHVAEKNMEEIFNHCYV